MSKYKNEKDLNILKDCVVENIKALGIEVGSVPSVKVNTRLRSVAGRCCRKRQRNKTFFVIEINNDTLRCSDEFIEDTMYHEVIHACKDAFNHGEHFKRYAKKVNNTYGYNVKRTFSEKDTGTDEKLFSFNRQNVSDAKYELYCSSCNASWKYKTFCDAVKNPSRFYCKKCNKDLKSRGINGYDILRPI